MRIFFTTFLLLFLFHISFGQQRVVLGSSLYGLSGNLVYKADTLGNANWVLDFSGKINSGISDTNHLNQIVSDGRFLYITSLQTIGPGIFTYYPAIIVLDTLGTIHAIRYWIVNPTGSYFFANLRANIDGGVWLSDYTTSLSYHLKVSKIDSQGIFTSEIGAWMSTDTYFNDMELLNDSSYILSTITPLFGGSGVISTITKIDRSGSPLWRKSISHSTLRCYPEVSQIDSAGKIVMFFELTDPGVNAIYTVGTIFSSTGVLLTQKTWPQNSISSTGEITFQNNHILYDDGTSIFNFDYNLLDSCLGLGVNESIIVHPETLQIWTGTIQYASGFLPVIHSLIQVAPLNTTTNPIDSSLGYCLILDVNELPKEESFTVFPNPAISNLKIQLNGDESYGIEIKYEVIDLNGRLIETGKVNSSGDQLTKINISDYKPRFYFVRIKSDNQINITRFIKQ